MDAHRYLHRVMSAKLFRVAGIAGVGRRACNLPGLVDAPQRVFGFKSTPSIASCHVGGADRTVARSAARCALAIGKGTGRAIDAKIPEEVVLVLERSWPAKVALSMGHAVAGEPRERFKMRTRNDCSFSRLDDNQDRIQAVALGAVGRAAPVKGVVLKEGVMEGDWGAMEGKAVNSVGLAAQTADQAEERVAREDVAAGAAFEVGAEAVDRTGQ